MTVGEIAGQLPVSRPAVSQHLAVLREAGLVSERPAGTRRFQRLEADGFDALRKYSQSMWDRALGRFGEAASHFERATAEHPRYYEAWIGLGRAHEGLGDVEAALAAWRTVTEMQPPAPEPALAEAYRRMDALVKARQEGTENTE